MLLVKRLCVLGVILVSNDAPPLHLVVTEVLNVVDTFLTIFHDNASVHLPIAQLFICAFVTQALGCGIEFCLERKVCE